MLAQIVRSETEVGHDLENLLADGLPHGVGFVEIQPHGAASETLLFNDPARTAAAAFRIHSPSLLVESATWFEVVTWLMQRAEMILVLMGGGSVPILDRFSRVLSLADLETDVLSTFVFTGLLERLVQIRDTPTMSPPVSMADLREAFERMTIRCRREGRGAADRYLANAVRLALDSGDTEGALQMTSLRIDYMTADEGAQLVSRLADALGDVSPDDPSRMLTVARLAILRVKTMTDADEAVARLDATTRRCLDPPNHRALSALETSRGWQLRLTRDADGALQAGYRALELAAPVHADLEAARALHLIGVACHERGDLERAIRALEQASDLMPSHPFNDDLVLILLRLGDVMRASGLQIAARSVFDLALRTSEAFGFTQGLAIARERLDVRKADHRS